MVIIKWKGPEFQKSISLLENILHFKFNIIIMKGEDNSSRLTLTGMITNQLLAQDSLSSNLKHSNYTQLIDVNSTYLYRMPYLVNNLNLKEQLKMQNLENTVKQKRRFKSQDPPSPSLQVKPTEVLKIRKHLKALISHQDQLPQQQQQMSPQLYIELNHPLQGLKTLDSRDLKLHGEHLNFNNKPSPKKNMFKGDSPSSINESPVIKMQRKYKDYKSNLDIRNIQETPLPPVLTQSVAVGSDHESQQMDKTQFYLREPPILKRAPVKVITTRNSAVNIQQSSIDNQNDAGVPLKSQFSRVDRQASQSSILQSQQSQLLDNHGTAPPKKIKLLSIIASNNQSARHNQLQLHSQIILPPPSNLKGKKPEDQKHKSPPPIKTLKSKIVNFELPQNDNIEQFLNSTFFRNKLESSFRSHLSSVQDRMNSSRLQHQIQIKKPQIVITAGGGFNLQQKHPSPQQKDDIISGGTSLIGVTPDAMVDTKRRDRSFESVVAQLSTKRKVIRKDSITRQAIEEVAKLAQVTRNIYQTQDIQKAQNTQSPQITQQMFPTYQAQPNSPHLKSINVEKIQPYSKQPVVKLPNIYNFDSLNFDYTEYHMSSFNRQQSNTHHPRLEPSPNIPSIVIQKQELQMKVPSNHKSFLEQIETQFNNQTRQKEAQPSGQQKQTVPIQRITHFAPWNETNKTFYNVATAKRGNQHQKTKSLQSNQSIVHAAPEDLILGMPDDMTALPNGQRIDRSGFPQC